MKISIETLKENGACSDGMEWLESLGTLDLKTVIEKGIEQEQWSHLRYGLSYLMTKPQRVEWVIFCAESVLHIYEDQYPENNAPRKAIDAAKNWLKNTCEKTRKASSASASAASTAAAADDAAYAADDAYAAAAAAASTAAASAFVAASYDASAYTVDTAAFTAAIAADIVDGVYDAMTITLIWKGYKILTGDTK